MTPEQQRYFLRSRFIAHLPSDMQAFLVESADVIKLSPRTYLHRKGDTFTGVFCLLSGKLKATGVTKQGAEYSLAHLYPGAVFGEIAYLDGKDRTHDTISITQSDVARLSKPALDKCCVQFPNFYRAIVQLSCQHLRQAFSVVDDFLTLNPEQRLAKQLIALSTKHKEQMSIDINQQELAAWMGISRQSINKILRKWQTQGWISIHYRQLIITQPAAVFALYSA